MTRPATPDSRYFKHPPPRKMAKFLKPNKVVVLTKGRHAGKKAVIVKNTYRPFSMPCRDAGFRCLLMDGWAGRRRLCDEPHPLLSMCIRRVRPSHHTLLISSFLYIHFDEGDKSTNKRFGCALVVGIDRAPLKVTKAMDARKIARRSRVKPFVKLINYNHVMPTRYTFDVDLKERVSVEIARDPAKSKQAKQEVRKVLEEKYNAGQNKWFFQKLRF